MKEVLKHYRMKLRVLSPVHVGSGKVIGKKEYIYLPEQHRVLIPDVGKMYMDFHKRNLTRAYEEYMLENRREDLGGWMKRQRYPMKLCEAYKKYELDAGDAVMTDTSGRSRGLADIVMFTKDAYGQPYIPGSSIKGMIRTALLAWLVSQNRAAYQKDIRSLEMGAKNSGRNKECLRRETDVLEADVFHTLNRTEKVQDAVNSRMSGLVVSDSVPVDTERLTLCQKIDVSLDGKEHRQPVLRESLKPETEIFFELTLDEKICGFTLRDILAALDYYNETIYRLFYTRFNRGTKASGTLWLGAGTGFAAKTVMYPLLENRAVPVIDDVFRNTLGKKYTEHKHTKDRALNIAPHMCKCTRYQGQLYDTGMCRIEHQT